MRNMSLRIGDIEVRTCSKELRTDRPHETCEVVKWDTNEGAPETCYTLAYWVTSPRSGIEVGLFDYGLKYCGSRPFSIGDANLRMFHRLTAFADKILNVHALLDEV
jgi:hypothetical protein